ncbi:MAG: type transport system ATP-binding protein [Mycobacteriales bacterium]
MSESAVEVLDVSKRFRLYRERNQSLKAALMRRRRAKYEDFWALRDVSFSIPVGSTFGLIGENGSGKSTLLKCIARILLPDKGSVGVTGSLAALLELGSGFHPELSGRENIYLNGSILGLSKRDIDARLDGIVEFAGIGEFIDQPVKNYSSGMYVRLGFSVAINVEPDILLVDEVLAVGDTAFQERCMEKFAEFRRAGRTTVVVSHAMGSLRQLCDQAAWLAHGELIRTGPANEIVDSYVDEGHTERAQQMGTGSRWGSGEARLTKVELLDRSGRPTTLVRTGDPVTFRLHFQADEPVEKPVFGLALENLEGVYVWAHHTRDAEFVPDRIAGTGRVDLAVPRMMLQEGTFDLLASIVDYSTTHTYDFLRHCYRFDVRAGNPRESGGIVAFDGTWGNLVQGTSEDGSSASSINR